MSTPIIPSHLQPHVAPQHYDDYTPTDHAVWRYVMRLNLNTLQDTAHPAYLEGLAASGYQSGTDSGCPGNDGEFEPGRLGNGCR